MALFVEGPVADQSLSFHAIASTIGAEVTGIDLRQALDAGTVTEIRRQLLRYKVLVLRNQPIDDAQQTRFAGYFDKGIATWRGQDDRIGPDTPPRPPRRCRAWERWQIDRSFGIQPPAVSILRGVTVPGYGGHTNFVDLHGVYEGLSASLRDFIGTLHAVHIGDRHGAASLHPLVSIHPETHRKALFLGRAVHGVHGLRPSESDALLQCLGEELIARTDLQACVHWTKNAVVLWDNRAVARAGPFDGFSTGERCIHRISVDGGRLEGPDGFVSRPLLQLVGQGACNPNAPVERI